MMLVLTIAVSRLVPLLFLTSFFLVAGRFLYDRFSASNRWLGSSLFICMLILGAIAAAPSTLRAYAVTMAETSYLRHDWESADRYFTWYAQLKGKCGDTLSRDWVQAVMNRKKWRVAEAILLAGMTRHGERVSALPENVMLLGICRYYGGNYFLAERTLLKLSQGMPQDYLKNYFLGRIAEKRGDSQAARAHYEDSLKESPVFFPAVYQAIRAQILLGDRDAALRTMNAFTGGRKLNDPLLKTCEDAIRGGPAPAPMEFLIVQISS